MKKIVFTSHCNAPLLADYASIGARSGGLMDSVIQDSYDSKVQIFSDDNRLMFESDKANVDSSNRLPYKVELQTGEYMGICGIYHDKKAIYLYEKVFDDVMQKWYCIFDYPAARIHKCIQENPNHSNLKVITDLLIHCGGFNWDGSHGCLTLHPEQWSKFIDFFKINEKVIIVKK